ncbi:MAG: hypothetical protein U1E60_02640 [Reyranellaceae bacterium]
MWRPAATTLEPMIAAIIFTGLMGLFLVARRRSVSLAGLGLVALLVCGLLVWNHLQWLQE